MKIVLDFKSESSNVSITCIYISSKSSLYITHFNSTQGPGDIEIVDKSKCGLFLHVESSSLCYFRQLFTYLGTIEGQKFALSSKSDIDTGGKGLSIFPGDKEGIIAENEFCIYK